VIAGDIYDKLDQPANLLYSGVLFVGSLYDFRIRETETNANRLDLLTAVRVHPTGGWLAEQGHLWGYDYMLDFMAVDCETPDSDVSDFGEDISTLSILQFNMIAIPEPSTVVLLLGGFGVLALRRWR